MSSVVGDVCASERPTELISLLDSEDSDTVEQTKALIHENLYKSRDPSLLNALVDCFLETRSTTALQILTNIHEARIHNLFEKLNDCLKHYGIQSRINTLTLLGYIVRRQPSWLYKIVKTSLFETVIKSLKSESDVLFLVNGILTITTLLPLIPTSVGSWLNDLFDIYTRLAAFLNSRPGNVPDVFLLHLHVAVYNYFHRLYAMYPNNFMVYLKAVHHDSGKQILFQTTIKPMLEHVRLHPCLVTETSLSEMGKHRWRKKEPQDIVIECQNISLDPVDRLQSENSLNTSWTSRQSLQDIPVVEKSNNLALATPEDQFESQGCDVPRLKERRMSDSATQTGKSLQSGDSGTGSMPLVLASDLTPGWSPSDLCGLSTPPSSQMSPSTSNPDLTLSLTHTPAVMNTPGDSPTTSLLGDVADANQSRGKWPGLGKVSSGRGTPVAGIRSHSQDSSLTYKTIHSALLQHKSEEIEHRTSTPKSSESPLTDINRSVHGPNIMHCNAGFPYERQTSEVSMQSEPVTPIDKVSSYNDEFENVYQDPRTSEPQEQLTCSEKDISVESATKEMERILRQSSYASVELPQEPPPSIDVSFSYNNTSHVSAGNNLIIQDLKASKLDRLKGGIPRSTEGVRNPEHKYEDMAGNHQDTYLSLSNKDESKDQQTVKSTDTLESSSRAHSVTPTPQDNQHRLQTYAICLSHAYHFSGLRADQEISWMDNPMAGSIRPTDRPSGSRPTPVEILDYYIHFGSAVHEELARISLVSQSGTNWTHFGGEAPVDEIEILRGQIQLLHQQLLYERHKCEQHAIRNRRLIGKTFKAVQYQEELQAIKDHLRLQEEKMRELTEALNKQTEDNRKLKEITSGWDNQQQSQLRNLLNENAQLQYTKGDLKSGLEKQREEYDALQMDLNQAKSKIFTLEQELDHIKPKLDEKAQLRAKIDKLTKEIVVMGEINEHHKDTIKKVSLNNGKNPEAEIQLHCYQREISAAKHMAKKQRAEVDALLSKVSALETSSSKKDIEMSDMKKFAESLNGTYQARLKALEGKYEAQKKINQTMEAHILNLQLALQDTTLHKLSKKVQEGEASGGHEPLHNYEKSISEDVQEIVIDTS